MTEIAEIGRSALLLLVLLNPFLLVVYLLQLVRTFEARAFLIVLLRAAGIAGVVFFLFAWFGDYIFTDLLQVRYSAFLIFGGLLFLLIGIRFFFQGPDALELLRGEPEHVAGAVAMPFMIGPATINASILAGSRLSLHGAMAAILLALIGTVVLTVLLKILHDFVNKHQARLVERYVDIAGRLSALVIGTIAVEMMLKGMESWLSNL